MKVKFHEPIGSEIYGPLLVRITVGLYLFTAGIAKIHHIPEFVDQIKSYHVFSDNFATVYGILIPYLQILAGGFLIMGFWTTLGAIMGALMIFSFIYVEKSYPGAGPEPLLQKDIVLFATALSKTFSKELVLLGATLSLLYSGAGAFSIDKFRKNG